MEEKKTLIVASVRALLYRTNIEENIAYNFVWIIPVFC